MKDISGIKYSVNVCRTCRRQLTIIADRLQYDQCPDCSYLHAIGVYTIEQYNKWLTK